MSDQPVPQSKPDLLDIEALCKALPEEDQRRHREACESIIAARRAAERDAHGVWIS